MTFLWLCFWRFLKGSKVKLNRQTVYMHTMMFEESLFVAEFDRIVQRILQRSPALVADRSRVHSTARNQLVLRHSTARTQLSVREVDSAVVCCQSPLLARPRVQRP